MKTWNSLHNILGEAVRRVMAQNSTKTILPTACSSTASFATRGDNRARRRRARERGDIQSSADSVHHYNTPVNGYVTPSDKRDDSGVSAANYTTLPSSHRGSPIDEAVPLPAVKPLSNQSQQPTIHCPDLQRASRVPFDAARTSSSSSVDGRCTMTQLDSLSASESGNESLRGPELYKGSNRRQQRKSRLSEVYVAEGQSELIKTPAPHHVSNPSSTGGDYERPGTGTVETAMRRLTVTRMSSSGTQIFTPNEDGVELDGLPVGPQKRPGRLKERRAIKITCERSCTTPHTPYFPSPSSRNLKHSSIIKTLLSSMLYTVLRT